MAVRHYRNQTILLPKVLVTLAGFGAFALFSERPMNNGAFWIMLPVGVRLAETSRADADAAPDAAFIPARSAHSPPYLTPGTRQGGPRHRFWYKDRVTLTHQDIAVADPQLRPCTSRPNRNRFNPTGGKKSLVESARLRSSEPGSINLL